MFGIADARRVQHDFGLLNRHVLYLDLEDGLFSLAHTQAERDNQVMVSLTECAVHHWVSCVVGMLHYCDGCFPATGWYQVMGAHMVEPLVF